MNLIELNLYSRVIYAMDPRLFVEVPNPDHGKGPWLRWSRNTDRITSFFFLCFEDISVSVIKLDDDVLNG